MWIAISFDVRTEYFIVLLIFYMNGSTKNVAFCSALIWMFRSDCCWIIHCAFCILFQRTGHSTRTFGRFTHGVLSVWVILLCHVKVSFLFFFCSTGKTATVFCSLTLFSFQRHVLGEYLLRDYCTKDYKIIFDIIYLYVLLFNCTQVGFVVVHPPPQSDIFVLHCWLYARKKKKNNPQVENIFSNLCHNVLWYIWKLKL